MKIEKYEISNNGVDLEISKSEIMRYLGYKKGSSDKRLDVEIMDAVEELQRTALFNYVYRDFDVKKDENSLIFKDSSIMTESKKLRSHLINSNRAVVMAVTLGFQVEKKFKYYTKLDLSKGIVYEACAAALIEELCDYVQREIEAEASEEGYYITDRYSPGYGDLSLEVQPHIIKALDAQKRIGLSTTENHILIPRKSVTAIIGLTVEDDNPTIGCKDCNKNDDCDYKNKGE